MNEDWMPPQEVEPPTFRIPPQAIAVEKHVIGAVLMEGVYGGALVDSAVALARLKPEDLYLEKHQLIWEAMRALHAAARPIDLLTLSEALQQAGRLELAGGRDYLMEISSEVVSSANVEQHTEIVKDKSLLRRIIGGSTEILEEAYTGGKDVREILGMVEALALNLAEDRYQQGFLAVGEFLPETLRQVANIAKGEMTGIPTGLTDVDAITGGLQPTDLILLAARPGMGKTALAISIMAKTAMKHKKRVGLISMEMGRHQIMQRLLCIPRGTNLHHLRTGRLSHQELEDVGKSADELRDLPIFIDDASKKTPLEILSQSRRLMLTRGLDMLFVDYLQLADPDTKSDSQNEDLEQIGKGLKAIAKDLNIPVIALSQLNRKIEGRGDHKPLLSDLRGSGGLEQVADIVAFLGRPEVYSKEAEPGLAEIEWAKYRNGPAGATTALTFHKESASFSDYLHPTLLEGEPRGRNTFSGQHKTSSAPPPRDPSDPGPTPPPRHHPRPGEADFD